MSLIYRALNKSRSETATQLNQVLLDMGTDGAQIPTRKSRKNVDKGKNSNGRKRTSRKKETPKSNLQVSAKNGRKGGGKRKTVGTSSLSLIKLLHPRGKGVRKRKTRKTSLLSISILGSILAATIAFYYVCNYTNIIPQFNRGKEAKIRLKDDIDFSLYAKASKENVPVSVESIQDLAKAELQPVENLEGTNKDVLINLPTVQGNDAVEVMPSSVTNVPAVEGQIVEYFEAETQIPEREVKQEAQVLSEQLQDLEGIQYIAKAELQPVEGLEGTNKDTLIELPQAQSNNLAQSALSSLTNVMQPAQEIASPIEVQPVEYADAETLIREDEIEQEAQVLSERPQSNDDWYASYHFGLGVFYQKNNEIEKAIEEYNKIIEFAPDNAEVHINLGVIYKDRGDLDRAVEEYEKALAIDPWLDVGHNNLGVVYFLKWNYAEAIRHYQKAIEINPKNLESHINLGIAYGMQKRSDEAVKALQTAISINPRNAETQYNLAVIYDENGEIEKALLYYSKFLEFYPATESELINKVKRRIDILSSRLR